MERDGLKLYIPGGWHRCHEERPQPAPSGFWVGSRPAGPLNFNHGVEVRVWHAGGHGVHQSLSGQGFCVPPTLAFLPPMLAGGL